ncbi:MAG: mechanosensitive ion channel family protein [Elusimicrobiota bacterium]
MNKIQLLTERYTDLIISYAPKLASALAVFIVGLWITNLITKIVSNIMLKRNLDGSLQSFLSSLLSVSLKVLLLVTVAGMLGLQTTSFVAVIGAAGLAVGLALQGSLSNFAGGVLILVFKPFKVGDLIESNGQFGEVKEIQIFNTVILTPENKTVILANSAVSNGTLINYSRHGNLRIDLTMTIAANMSVIKAKQIAMNVLTNHPKILKDPAPTVNVLGIGAGGAVTLAVRPYATPADYWTVYFDGYELLKKAFDEQGIEGPIPHQVIIQKQEVLNGSPSVH